MDIIKSIILFAKSIFDFILGIACGICSFLGDKTLDFMVKLDPSCVTEFNKVFNTTDKAVSMVFGMLEISLLAGFIKYIIVGIRDISYSDSMYGGTGEISGIGGMIDELEAEEEFSGKCLQFGVNNDFNNQWFQQQMIDESNRQFMKESMDEAMKAVTPADEGGNLHGAYLNPSDTFAYEEQQSMFDDSMANCDFDTFDSCNSFNDFGCDNSFSSFNDF